MQVHVRALFGFRVCLLSIHLDDPWSGILIAASFVMHSTYHSTLYAMPGQLIFGRDMILNMQYLADWTAIKAHKQELICKNNIIENSKCIPHHYRWEIK